jgi:hypothetical protein
MEKTITQTGIGNAASIEGNATNFVSFKSDLKDIGIVSKGVSDFLKKKKKLYKLIDSANCDEKITQQIEQLKELDAEFVDAICKFQSSFSMRRLIALSSEQ